ncbi:hypothetical protein PSTG_18855 [Puccinia striiformis f. sp. tritici PST-78]|uniref:Uncharacterized protein n=1 Tax=Puccinia striiformis f. sp. tritici PST-78 TaxID=1165861 RepID=A0A0L0ULV5_9BASI|nr:hypothetical protein PSTG_18855 [Puccinia striiformis f. sp. tritici PST-78]
MRHLSATETSAKPLHNDYLLPANQHLAVECNRAGIELFEKLLADNPALARFARARDVEVSGSDVEPIHLNQEIKALLRGIRTDDEQRRPRRRACSVPCHQAVFAVHLLVSAIA